MIEKKKVFVFMVLVKYEHQSPSDSGRIQRKLGIRFRVIGLRAKCTLSAELNKLH